jgi:hypothetical protein
VVAKIGTRLKLAGTKNNSKSKALGVSAGNGMVVWINSICRVNEYFACSIKAKTL